MRRVFLLPLLLFCLVALVAMAFLACGAAAEVPRPYLMLVTFGAPWIKGWTAPWIKGWTVEQCKQANTWPYAGIASMVVGAYDTEPVPSRKEFDATVKLLRAHATVHVWPWVFLNRMIGYGKGQTHPSVTKRNPYFERIKGWDLEDKAGARSDFLTLWRLSLQLAKDLGSPGIVLDMETYNDYSTYQLSALAEAGGWTPEQTTTLLKRLGREMAVILAEEYPSAMVWNLFTGIGGTRTTGIVCEGLLEEATRRKLPMKMIDGGETAVGYYNPTVEVLLGRIRSHVSYLQPFVEKYGGRIVAGGTIAPYHEPDKITSWIRDASMSGKRVYRNVEEFRPNFDALFARCEYVWVYGASAACCVPFDPANATTTTALHRLLGYSYPLWQEGYRMLSLPLRDAFPKESGSKKVEFAEQAVDVSEWTKGDPKSDMQQPELVVEPDAEVVKIGSKSVKMTVNVNWKEPAGAKYPVGWPMIHKMFSPPLDLSAFNFFDFWVRIHTEATLPSPPLKFGLSNDNAEPLWQGVETTKKDEWVHVRVPLDRLGPHTRITRLTFYVAESWYRDGDVVTFYLDGLKFLRQTTPEIGSFSVEPIIMAFGEQACRATYTLLGDAVKEKCRLQWKVTPLRSRKIIREGLFLASEPTGQIPVPTSDLPPGPYRLTLRLLSAKARELDSAEQQFAIVGK